MNVDTIPRHHPEAQDLLEELIRQFEGCKLTAYKCPAGVWTIGWGHTAGVKEGQKWTQAQADVTLMKDAEASLKKALTLSPVLAEASPGQQAAVADFVYNCGEKNYRNSTFRRDVDRLDFQAAKKSILLWNKARNPKTGMLRPLAGLTRRREAEARLL